jgi:hypothetical protein
LQSEVVGMVQVIAAFAEERFLRSREPPNGIGDILA